MGEPILVLIRSVCLFTLWVGLSWPVWSFAVDNDAQRVIDLLPFGMSVVLLMERSYESQALDWRVLLFLCASTASLSLGSFYTTHPLDSWKGLVVIVCMGVVSSLGALTNFHKNRKFNEEVEKRVTVVAVAFMFACAVLVGWGIIALYPGSMYQLLIVQLLLGLPVVGACLLSLFFPGRKRKVGVGSPLLCLSVRFILAPGATGFWAWAVFCVLAYIVLNCLHEHEKVGFFEAIKAHWRGWQEVETSNSSLTITVCLLVFLLVLSGETNYTIASPRVADSVAPISRVASSLSLLKSEEMLGCSPAQEWRRGALDNGEKILISILEVSQGSSMEVRTVHYMFEETGSILTMILLLSCSIMYYIRRIGNKDAQQGFWQPVFFFSAAMMICFYRRTKNEVLADVEGRLSIIWAEDAIMAIALSVFGGILGCVIAMFRVKADPGNPEEWTVTRNRVSSITSGLRVTRNREEGLIPGVVSLAIALLLILEIARALPLGAGFSYQSAYDAPFYNVVPNASSADGAAIQSLIPLRKNFDWSILGVNCTTEGECLDSMEMFESLLPTNCTRLSAIEWGTVASAFRAVSEGRFGSLASFGLRDMMAVEEIVLLVISLLKICSSFGGYWFPLFDDISLALVGAQSALISIAIPFRVTELKGFSLSADRAEWFVPLLCILIAFDSGMSFYARLYLKAGNKDCHRWPSMDDLRLEFEESCFVTYASMLEEYGYDPEGVTNLEEAWKKVSECDALTTGIAG